MAKLIENSTLPADYTDGQILYGEDINKIIRILRESANTNWMFIQTVIGGSSDVIYAESYIALTSVIPSEGTYGYVVDITRGVNLDIQAINSLAVYKYVDSSWTYIGDLSLVDFIDRLAALESALPDLGFSTIYTTATQPENMHQQDLWLDISDN